MVVRRRHRGRPLVVTSLNLGAAASVTDTNVAQRRAYTATGEWWQTGPGRIYDRMAAVLVAHVPRPLDAAVVIDVGAGTGAASRAAMAAGAAVVIAVDAAHGMVAADSRRRPPAVAGDATHLPLRTASADVVLAAFSFNHLADPAAGFAEAARVARPGGAIAVSTYAADDRHPVKAIVEEELGALGWSTPAWYVASRARAAAFATPAACRRAAAAAGLDATVDRVEVPFPELGPGDLVAWRLGMAHHAPFVRRLSAAVRCGVLDRATERVRAEPLLRRSVLLVTVSR